MRYSLSILAHIVSGKPPILFVDSVTVGQRNELSAVHRLLCFSEESNTSSCFQLWRPCIWLLDDCLVNTVKC